MSETMPQWRGLFDWSMKYQDGTTPTDWGKIECSPEKLKWLEDVMKNYMVDFADRMKDIQCKLSESASTTATSAQIAESEALLEELIDIVDSIDFARDLRTIGGLPTLKNLMQSEHASLKSRAAEVVATCCQNNPPVQEWFVEEGVMQIVTELLTQPEAQVRAKGLLAVSAMVRGNPLGLSLFCKELQGLPIVVSMVSDKDQRSSRKALEFLKVTCMHAPALRVALASSPPVLEALATKLACSDELIVSSCIGLLGELIDDRDALHLVRQHAALVDAISAVRTRLQALSGEDREAMLEELELIETIDDACAPVEQP